MDDATRPIAPVGGRGGAEIPADHWEGCSAGDLMRAWKLPRVHIFRVVGSTNDVARSLAASGAPTGTLVIAEEQRAGRGRGARVWSSPPGLGLWCSFVLRGLPADAVAPLPLRVALAVATALDGWVDYPVRIKWPNDLLLTGRKVGGILCEASWDGRALEHVTIGIGLNLLQAPDDFPEELRSLATSLRLGTDRPVSRYGVASDIVQRLRPLILDRYRDDDRFLPTAELAARDALRGLDVDVYEPDSGRLLTSGLACGFEADGALRIDSGGQSVVVRTGTVRPHGQIP